MSNNKYPFLVAVGLSSVLTFVLFIWQSNKGFSLWDEGFLWYGVQRAMLGEVPIRDFLAYEPGRYYWSAAIMGLMGNNGIISLRIAVAIFQTLGLFTGILLISRAMGRGADDFLYLLLSGLALVIWMYPRHKLFDISSSIFLIGVLTFLIEKPTARSHFIAGCCVGGIAIFGKNHGLYGVVGSLGALWWVRMNGAQFPGLLRGFFLWASGVIVGFMPMALMGIFVPGFATAFLGSILFLFEQKATNLPLPVPWPWMVDLAAPIGDVVRDLLVGLFFLAVLIFGPLMIGWGLYQKMRGHTAAQTASPALVAAVLLALPYAHFAFSRADVGHLALGIFPLLIGLLVLFISLPAKLKWLFAVALCTGSLWVMHIFHPGWQCLMGKHCVDVEISGDVLQVDPATKSDVMMLRQLAEEYAPNGQNIVVTPFWPGAYPLLDRQSPMWEIYALFPRSEAFEIKEIERIRKFKPALVFVFDMPLDGLEELRFSKTHPLTYQYILKNFDIVQYSSNPFYQVFITRDAKQ
jgi:hypothetical protein